MKLKIGLPIGSLQQSTLDMMRRAGFNVTLRPRSYYPEVDDDELQARLMRPQDMSRFVEKGVVDCGLTGTLQPFRWVIAVPEDSSIRSIRDLDGKRISTELVNVARRFLAQHGVRAEVEFSHGATESKAPDLVDAIIDGTETGTSLRANRMRIVETVMVSTTQFIANRQAWADPWKRRKMESLAILFQGAIAARYKVGLKMNVAPERLQDVLNVLPAMKRPTVSNLAEGAGYALETIVDETVVRHLLPELRRAGAEAIVEYPLNKVIP